MDPLKNPFFECYLRLNQLNFVCNRIREEYQNISNIKNKKHDLENQILTENKKETKADEESEDSFLSADLSFEENNDNQNQANDTDINLDLFTEEGEIK